MSLNLAPARHWCFTLNNPHDALSCACLADACDAASTRLEALKYVRYYIFQLEKGDSGTPHLQGYIEFSKPSRPGKVVRALPGAHIEKRCGTAEEAVAYCRKDDTRISGPFVWGTPPAEGGQGSRSDLSRAAALLSEPGGTIRQLAEEQPTTFIRYFRGFYALQHVLSSSRTREPPVVTLIYGEPGCGKTKYVYDLFAENLKDLFHKPPGSHWFDGYDQHSSLLMDDFDGSLPLVVLLQLLDRYNTQMQVKGHSIFLNAIKNVYITSNLHPCLWYSWTGREVQYLALCRRIHFVYAPIVGSLTVVDRQKFLTPHDNVGACVSVCNVETMFEVVQ